MTALVMPELEKLGVDFLDLSVLAWACSASSYSRGESYWVYLVLSWARAHVVLYIECTIIP